MTPLYFIEWDRRAIQEQLEIEEAILRTDDRNVVIVNHGTSPAIVIGLSGQKVDSSFPLIQRYSGGGTVFVDENTLFISFIFSKKDLGVAPFPEPIMQWGCDLYQKAWNIEGFSLRENDYAIFDHKCGGNAQYICKNRWVHHTSFLWDFSIERMNVLELPKRQPKYRLNRSHGDFLSRLKDFVPSRHWLIHELKRELVKRFYMTTLSETEIEKIRQREHRQATRCFKKKGDLNGVRPLKSPDTFGF